MMKNVGQEARVVKGKGGPRKASKKVLFERSPSGFALAMTRW
jgi:hypothetical protein